MTHQKSAFISSHHGMTTLRTLICENAALAAIYIRQQAERLASETVSNADAQAWIDLFWGVSKELNCLPSSYVDGNAHVLRAAAQARTALSAQMGAQKNGGGKA
ncbi:hypothetical protein [Achromobacter kerstersii]